MIAIIQNTIRNHEKCIKLTKCLSLFSISSKNEKSSRSYVPVYKFPYIVPLSLINRLKAYHTILTAACVPVAIGLHQLNYISGEGLQFTVSLGFSGCLTLYSLGYWAQNFIGFIYYNEEEDIVKVSYIDFWGIRKEIEMPKNDIVPINEMPTSLLSGLFLHFRRFSTKDTLKFNLQFGLILDKEKIKQIL